MSFNGMQEVERHAFAGMYVLRHLILSNNDLTKLESNLLDDLGELIKLNLSGNRISTIPRGFFDLNGNLKVLDLSYNRFQAFDVYVPVNRLCYLSLDGNNVDELILHLNESVANECDRSTETGGFATTSTSPIIVTANGNNIRKLVLPKFLAVNALSLNGNQISDVENVTRISTLHQLYLADNPIDMDAVLHVVRLTELRHLSVAGVRITELDFRIFANLTHLHELDISNNGLPTLDLTDINSLHELRKLNISNNRLMHIDFDYLRQYYPHLKVIDINRNQFGCDILKEMLHVSFRRQRINAIPRRDQLLVKNQPNVDGISCLLELNTGHLEHFERKLWSDILAPLENRITHFKVELLNAITEVKMQTSTKVTATMHGLEKRMQLLEDRLMSLTNHTEQVMYKLVKLLDAD